MIYPSIDKLLGVISSKFELALLASRRSEEMKETGFYQMPPENYKSTKDIGKALEELSEGLITITKEE